MQTSLTLNDVRAIPQLGLGVWQTPADTTALALQTTLAILSPAAPLEFIGNAQSNFSGVTLRAGGRG